MTRGTDWFGILAVGDAAFALAAYEKVQQLLTSLQPDGLDRSRSTADFGDAHVQIDLHHVSGLDRFSIDLHYSHDQGGMFSPLGFEEYYRLRGDPPVEQDALDDLAVVLTSVYAVEETSWRGRRVRTVVRQEKGGEDRGTSVWGWPLLPPRWLVPGDQLTTRTHSVSYGGHLPTDRG